MFVETSAAVNYQNSRTRVVLGVVASQQTGQFCLAIANVVVITDAAGSAYVPSAEMME